MGGLYLAYGPTGLHTLFPSKPCGIGKLPYLLISVCLSNQIHLAIVPPSFKSACPSGLGFASPEPEGVQVTYHHQRPTGTGVTGR